MLLEKEVTIDRPVESEVSQMAPDQTRKALIPEFSDVLALRVDEEDEASYECCRSF